MVAFVPRLGRITRTYYSESHVFFHYDLKSAAMFLHKLAVTISFHIFSYSALMKVAFR